MVFRSEVKLQNVSSEEEWLKTEQNCFYNEFYNIINDSNEWRISFRINVHVFWRELRTAEQICSVQAENTVEAFRNFRTIW